MFCTSLFSGIVTVFTFFVQHPIYISLCAKVNMWSTTNTHGLSGTAGSVVNMLDDFDVSTEWSCKRAGKTDASDEDDDF